MPPDPDTIQNVLHQARATLGSGLSLLSDLSGARQKFLSMSADPLSVLPGTGIDVDRSICWQVAQMGVPLIVEDAYSHPLLMKHPAVTELGIAAYLGLPVPQGTDGARLVLCAAEKHRRYWSKTDIATLRDAAAQVREILNTPEANSAPSFLN